MFSKNHFLIVVLIFTVLFLGQPEKPFAQGVRIMQDQIGRTIKVPEQPRRIITLIPSLTEIVFDLGRGDLLVGATQYATEPAEAANLPRVGSYLHLDIERIVALQPDLTLRLLILQPGPGTSQSNGCAMPNPFCRDPGR